MRIRTYESRDLEACRALWVELTDWHRRLYDDPALGGDDPGRIFDEHLERIGREHVWIADEDGRIVGLAGLIVRGRHGELEPIVVAEPARGRGFGRALAEAVRAAAVAEGLTRLTVRPAARNADAVRFFHALGFDVLGHVDLQVDLAGEREWRPGETLAGRDFRV